jgi:hypothetical protein
MGAVVSEFSSNNINFLENSNMENKSRREKGVEERKRWKETGDEVRG